MTCGFNFLEITFCGNFIGVNGSFVEMSEEEKGED